MAIFVHQYSMSIANINHWRMKPEQAIAIKIKRNANLNRNYYTQYVTNLARLLHYYCNNPSKTWHIFRTPIPKRIRRYRIKLALLPSFRTSSAQRL